MFNINELFSNRIGGNNYLNNTTLHKFSKIKKAKTEAISKGEYVLDLAAEELDKKVDDIIIDSLYTETKKIENQGYTDNRYLEFNKSCSGYLRVELGVNLDYKSEIMRCIGIKEVLNILPLAFINKDDYVITTSLENNAMANMCKWLDCNIYEYKLNRFNNYLIDFEDIEENILKKCKMLYINYPNNPTGAVATKEFFKEVVKYAKKYNFIVVHDASYIDFCFDDMDKISFLSVEGARDIGVEIYDFSKSFNMRGWGIGFIAGNKDILKAYGSIKENIYSEQFLAVEKTAITALNNYERINKELKAICLRRHKLIKEVLSKHGFRSEVPKAGFYQYVSIPKSCNGVSFESAEEFSLFLIENVNIFVMPYDANGKYIRISVTFIAKDEEEEKEFANKLNERLTKFKFDF